MRLIFLSHENTSKYFMESEHFSAERDSRRLPTTVVFFLRAKRRQILQLFPLYVLLLGWDLICQHP